MPWFGEINYAPKRKSSYIIAESLIYARVRVYMWGMKYF